MAELNHIVKFLDDELGIGKIKDSCLNGLQVEGRHEIGKVGVAVDLTLGVINKAVEEKCDIIISHHALFWEPVARFTGILARRLEQLMKNSISVYVAHSPIDVHRKYSHGVLLSELLGMYGVSNFAASEGSYFGVYGHIRKPLAIEAVKEQIDKALRTQSRIYNYGKKDISSIAIVSGSGGGFAEEAFGRGVDCLITGEMKHSALLVAKDLGLNVILAGHYETETLGMVRLSRVITKKFKIPCIFLES